MGRDSMHAFWSRGLTASQWGDWLAYMGVVPLPADRADFAHSWQMAALCQTKDVEKFVPPWGRKREPQGEDELKASMGAVLEAERIRRENAK